MSNLRSQPTGSYTLFLAEVWDGFNYYGAQAVIVLFFISLFHYSDKQAYMIFGTFSALAFSLPVIGGFIADHLLGFRYAIIIGALGMILGNLILLFHNHALIYIGLGVMVCGMSLFRSNVSGLLSLQYTDDSHRDSGFTLYYMFMNIGNFLGPLVMGLITKEFGWHAGFLVSAAGLASWLLLYKFREKHFRERGAPKRPEVLRQRYLGIAIKYWIIPCFVAAIALFSLCFQYVEVVAIVLFIIAIVAVIYLLQCSYRLSIKAGNKIVYLLFLLVFLMLFYAGEWQTSTSLTLFIQHHVHRVIFGMHVPTVVFSSILPLFVVIFAPIAARWKSQGVATEHLAKRRMVIALLSLVVGFLVFALSAQLHMHSSIAILLLLLGNLLIGFGDIVTAPIVFASAAKLAPEKLKGTVMGTVFMSVSFSGYIAGFIATLSQKHAEHSTAAFSHTFMTVAYVMLGSAVVLLLLWRSLNKLITQTH